MQALLTVAHVTHVPGRCPANAFLTGAPEDPGLPVPGEVGGAGAVRRPGEDHRVHAGRQVPPSASQKPHPWLLPLRPEEGGSWHVVHLLVLHSFIQQTPLEPRRCAQQFPR